MGVSLSKQLLWLHMNRLSFMLKSQAESLAFMSAVYAQPLPEVISTWAACHFVRSASSLQLMPGRSVAAVINKK